MDSAAEKEGMPAQEEKGDGPDEEEQKILWTSKIIFEKKIKQNVFDGRTFKNLFCFRC